MGSLVPALDVGAELAVEVGNGLEHAAAYGVAFDQAEPLMRQASSFLAAFV